MPKNADFCGVCAHKGWYKSKIGQNLKEKYKNCVRTQKKLVTLHCQKEKTKILPCDIKKSKIGYCLG